MVIDPDSVYRAGWDFFLLILLIYIGLFVPFQISFPLNEPDIQFYFDICIDGLFIIDFFVNLNTGFYQKGKKIMKRK